MPTETITFNAEDIYKYLDQLKKRVKHSINMILEKIEFEIDYYVQKIKEELGLGQFKKVITK